MQSVIDGQKAEHVRRASDILDGTKPEKMPSAKGNIEIFSVKILVHHTCTETSRSGSETAQL